jgi:hypothetical protein
MIDKSTWGDGPWQTEPDELEWNDERTGLKCHIKRHPYYGHLCGYVGVPPGHVLYGWDYDDHVKMRAEFLQGTINEVSIISLFAGGVSEHGTMRLDVALKAHGGISLSGEPSWQTDDGLWWFGFDCGHAFDLSPGMAARLRQHGFPWPEMHEQAHRYDTYRDIEYVKQNCADLAFQLKQLEAEQELTHAIEMVKKETNGNHS